jgi:transcriptional regulator with XRE-family HTH domain
VLDGGLPSTGYRSGRKRWRETPVMDSIGSTRSAGSRRAEIQPEIVPWDLSPSFRASADCPPATRQASSNASSADDAASHSSKTGSAVVLTLPINAQTVNSVNAYSANGARHSRAMSRQPESEASGFWKRLSLCWEARNLPTTQNGVAKKLGMSQGSVRRWFAGEGFPETDTLIEIARLGRVSIDWLLTGKHHASGVDKDLDDLLEIWERLEGTGREHVVRAARGEAALTSERPGVRRASGEGGN